MTNQGILIDETLDTLKGNLKYPKEFDELMLASAAWILATTSTAALNEMGLLKVNQQLNLVLANIIAGAILADLINDRVMDPREALRYIEKTAAEVERDQKQEKKKAGKK